ncbi:hypothetical protein CJ030_MR1G019572 [Morella rubra]|uniref:Uncharacterized protein n=1 Tax=Morella rubra TaxID=262757 RepID=A0A6A1WM08_9ROSI|nr:hypothetical protein CJ030_MR1G019572 [Morella rubra]
MKPSREDIFHTLQGRDVVVVESFVCQNEMTPFWHIMHLIFTYNIKLRAHKTDCPIMRGKLMLIATRGLIADLRLYIFMTLQSKAKTPSSFGMLKEEVTTIRKDLTTIQERMLDLKQFMTTTPAQLRMLTKRMDNVEELLEKIL